MKNSSIFLAACFSLVAAVAVACQVPVFRYALERWAPDRYEIVVIHNGELSGGDKTSADALTNLSGKLSSQSNFTTRFVRVDTDNDPLLKQLGVTKNSVQQPMMAVLFPQNAQEVPNRLVSLSPMTANTVKQLTDSPVRREIAKRLISGQSAVWIFVPIGDAAQDEAALEILQTEVQRNQESLQLPEQEEAEGEDALLAEVDIELRLEFSIVTLRRDDPEEAFLLKMLMASESDLADLKQPMAFPVLGRGRVLYALIGKGIAEDTVGIASRFIIGPCSCQVKNQNPGFDLLMTCDWDDKIGTAKLSDEIPEERTKPKLLAIPPGRK
ncbi:MAG: hypothetical protein WBD20_18200 [Pirellulaceae bacterium]